MKRAALFLTLCVAMLVLLVSQAPSPPRAGAQDPTATPTPPAYPELAPGDYRGRIMSGGVERLYLLHVPPGYRNTEPMPLVVSYHGFTGDPVTNARATGLAQKANDAGFIAVFPAGQRDPAGWFSQPNAEAAGWLNDVTFTQDLLVALVRGLNIDRRRIYLTGFSNGGAMVHRLACDLSGVVAAVAPVSGLYFWGDPCDVERPVPLLTFHGKRDQNAPYNGYFTVLQPVPSWIKAWSYRNGCAQPAEVVLLGSAIKVHYWHGCDQGGDVIFVEYEQGEHVWPDGAEDVIWWFFEQHPLAE